MAAEFYVASEAQRAKCPELANQSIVFIIERSTNDNIVVYEANMAGDNLNETDPISVYWQDIDDAYMVKSKSKGKQGFRSTLNMIENKLAYGISSTRLNPNHHALTLVALPSKKVELVLVSGVPKASAVIASRPSYLHKIYVNAKSTMLGPKVTDIKVSGVAVDNGEAVSEVIIP